MKFPKKILSTVGKCMYCHSTESSLSDEHIVPYGLSGPWVLKKASCSECAKIISNFERTVLRESLMVARTSMALATRRKGKRPMEFSVSFVRQGKEQTIKVSIDDLVGCAVLPILEPPACLSEYPYEKGVMIKGVVTIPVGGLRPEEFANKYDAKSVITKVTFKGNDFERMLAKIGYGFAVAYYGLENILEVFVLPAIKGTVDDVGRWVGCFENQQTSIGHSLHEIRIGTLRNEVHVGVRLFASYGAPEYRVVVGKLK